jgi:pimeloyl-ACP methyl ester carboxylesterase
VTCLREGTIRLPDGRQLGYAEYGVRGGVPVLLFHGLPGGRGFELGRTELVDAGAWMFTLERPGIGLSDRQPGRTLLDWPGDVAAFADTFGLDRFAVVGFSAGAPYALACGHSLPARVVVVGMVCGGIAGVHEPALDRLLRADLRHEVQRYRGEPDRLIAEKLEQLQQRHAAWARDPEGFFDEWVRLAGDETLPRTFWMSLLASTFGGEPDIDEQIIRWSPWGFTVEDLAVPIRAWHGDADKLAPLAAVEELVRRAPDATLTVYPGEGHFLSPAHRTEYLSTLTSWR